MYTYVNIYVNIYVKLPEGHLLYIYYIIIIIILGYNILLQMLLLIETLYNIFKSFNLLFVISWQLIEYNESLNYI